MVGRLLRNIREHDRCVGGIDDVSTKRATELYSPVLTLGKVIPMTATAAEVTKTAENTFRDLQIAAANELALYCEAMGINFYDVRTGIDSLKGEGITRAMLWPGAGVGGHCLTKDTYHLERGVQVLGKGTLDYPAKEPSLYVLARHINDFMPTHMFRLTMDASEACGQVGERCEGCPPRLGVSVEFRRYPQYAVRAVPGPPAERRCAGQCPRPVCCGISRCAHRPVCRGSTGRCRCHRDLCRASPVPYAGPEGDEEFVGEEAPGHHRWP